MLGGRKWEEQARQFPLVLRMNHIFDMNKTQQVQRREKAEFCFRRERSNTQCVSLPSFKALWKSQDLGTGERERERPRFLHSLAALTGEKSF